MKLNLYPWLHLAIITPLIILMLLFNSCAPVQTQVPVVKSTPIPPTPTSNPPTPTPTPQTVAETLTVPECIEGGQSDSMTFDELMESLTTSLYEMESFRYRTSYRYATTEGYTEDELSIEVEGAHSGLRSDPVEGLFYPLSTQMYERSYMILTDLRTRSRAEATVINDAFWVKAPDSVTWMAFDPATSAELLNLAEVLSPQFLQFSTVGGGSLAPGIWTDAPLMVQTETIDGREVIHRCWLPPAHESGMNAYLIHYDDLYTFLSNTEVHLWTAENDTQLIRLVITGKHIGERIGEDIVRHETSQDFLLWMDLFDVGISLDIEAPSEVALTLPNPEISGIKKVDASYDDLPLPADAQLVGGSFGERESDYPVPREYLWPYYTSQNTILEVYAGPGYYHIPADRRPIYQTNMGFTEVVTFYIEEMDRQGWKLEEKYFQLGLPQLFMLFKRDEITMPVIVGPGEQDGTRIYAIVPPSDKDLEAILNGWVSYTHENSGLPEGYVTAITFDKQGRVLIGTDSGLSIFDGNSWISYTAMDMGLNGDTLFPGYFVSTLAIDSQERLWVGTHNGLAVFDGKEWKSYTREISKLPTNAIYGMSIDQQDRIWMSFKDISVFDSGTFITFTEKEIGKLDHDIVVIRVDQQNRVWIGTNGGGVYFYDGTDWNVALEEKAPENTTISGYDIEDLAIDQQGRVWIGTTGLSMYDGKTWTTYNTQNSELSFEYIDGIAFDANNDVWVATSFGGLGKLDANGNFTTYTSLNAGDMGYSTNAIAIDEQGRIWAGTDNGLYVFTPPN